MAIEPRTTRILITPHEAARRKLISAQAALDERRRAEEQARLQQWAAEYDRERKRLIGARALEAMRQIRPRSEREAADPLQREHQRFERVQLARNSGVDLEALGRLDLAKSGEFKRLAGLSDAAFPGALEWLEPEADGPLKAPVLRKGDGPPAPQAFQAPYAWWERYAKSFGWDDSEILANESYLNGDAGVLGSRLWGRNYDAGNLSVVIAERENGMMVPFTPAKTGVIAVRLTLQCISDQQRIWTYNEAGWSNASIFIDESVRIAAFWDFNDFESKGEAVAGPLTPLYWYVGNGDSHPGTWTKAESGATVVLTAFTSRVFQAGVPIWLYAGLRGRISGALDDVSANLWSVSSWYMRSIEARTY